MKLQISNRLVIAAMFVALVPLSLADAQKPSGVPAADARSVIALSQAVAPGGISELKEVDIGGIKQWISIRGNDRANPILLFIHGGPGAPMMPESWTFQRPWEDFFTVVQWDQRGAGKTFSAANRQPDASISIGQMQADAEQLMEWLKATYGKKKIFVMGHSWGSVLGLKVAQHHPEWLYAYIGVGQVVNSRRNEAVGYQQTLAQAEKIGNEQAIRELKALAPYPEADLAKFIPKVYVERKWNAALGGMTYGQTEDIGGQLRALSPLYTDYDVESARLGELSSPQQLAPQLIEVDFDNATDFKCPVVFFAGMHDRTTPESIVEEYYSRIHAPNKQLFKIKRASHYVVNEAPGEVLMDLVLHVLPFSHEGGAQE
jgi:pimeloyl-ACP methyl ester carboxylesterase